jgi:hypothetical protein
VTGRPFSFLPGTIRSVVRRDVIGFMWIDLPPGDDEIRLEFHTPLENTVGRTITMVALVLLSMAIFGRL